MADRVHFRMRSYQRVSFTAMQRRTRRFVDVWHRRAGKDRTWMNITLLRALPEVGNYFHVFPSLNQGRRDIWDNIIQERYADGRTESFPMRSAFPKELVKSKDETEMQITLASGSIWQIMGADSQDQIDRMRGSNPRGLIFSEFGHMNPQAWLTLAPVLAENRGWAAFIGTPNGKNHFHDLYKFALAEPEWCCQLLTVNDTRRDAEGEDGSAVVPDDEINQLRKQGVREEFIQQEFYCAWEGHMEGSIYGDVLRAARAEGRVGRFAFHPMFPVGMCFDLGRSDAVACWFYQLHGDRITFIDYHEEVRKDPQWWAHFLRERKQYIYGRTTFPWDGYAWESFFSSIGFRNITIAERPKSLDAAIDNVRLAFRQFYFDEVACARGLDCLSNYKRKWDALNNIFLKEPVHDQWSHGCDALRTGVAAGFGPLIYTPGIASEVKVETQFDLGGGLHGWQ